MGANHTRIPPRIVQEYPPGKPIYADCVTIWEKNDGFVVLVAADKEWIHSGNYTVKN